MSRSGATLIWSAFALTALAASVQAALRDSFRLQQIVAAPGEIASGFVPVPIDGLTEEIPELFTKIPISIAHGTHPGPVLLLIAGVHGTEYCPIEALKRLRRTIDAGSLRGTVIMVHFANPTSFWGRTSFKSPDGLNLNRSYPGRPDGKLTERIAYVLVHQLIARADAVIDIHCGDGNCDLIPWVGWYDRIGSPEVIRRSREMAQAFGIRLVTPFPFELGKYAAERDLDRIPTTYTGPNAAIRDIPTFDVESGRLRQVEEQFVTPIYDGIYRVMRYLEMTPEQAEPQPEVEYIVERDFLLVESDGSYYLAPGLKAGDLVRKGDPIATIKDVFDNVLQEVTAVNDGLVIVLATGQGQPVLKGEYVAMIARTDAEFASAA